jgi:hypothetical protein
MGGNGPDRRANVLAGTSPASHGLHGRLWAVRRAWDRCATLRLDTDRAEVFLVAPLRPPHTYPSDHPPYRPLDRVIGVLVLVRRQIAPRRMLVIGVGVQQRIRQVPILR